ncbi:MAG: S46 family peptidase, partial [Calditrichia bacterium]|nr:S46 family peptidase [Calditrichia bacterium]
MKFITLIIIVLTVLLLNSILTADEGMWMPHQMQELQLDELGLKMNPADLYKENGFGLMNAIVNLGGGTGAFVSKEGLILTNHHVAFSTIQQASDANNDYLKNGFIAWNKKEELPAIGKYADVLISYEEITEKIISKIHPDMSLEEKWQTLDKEQKKIIKAMEAESPDTRIKIAATFNGKNYYLYKFKRLRDIRIVYAPPLDIGNFGGEIDNWMWPRHTGDFSVFRVYSGPDGKPAEYSEENIPLVPKHYLPVSVKGIEPDDFAMILGYPGGTQRYMTSYGIEEQLQIT